MKRTYLALAGLALAGAAVLPAAVPPLARAAGIFRSQPVEASRFAVLARPIGRSDWTLLVLEQIKSEPDCWKRRDDGLVDPALNSFDFTGICSRYLDSNAYSLRIGEEDLASRYRLRIQQIGEELQLQATSPDQPVVLVVGRGKASGRDPDAFVSLELNEGWSLQRRAYEEQTLSHLYFAHGTSLDDLIAAASPQEPSPSPKRGRLDSLTDGIASSAASSPSPTRGSASPAGDGDAQRDLATPGRTIALQVVPYRGGN